jgi:Protein of unknown function (DUF2442)
MRNTIHQITYVHFTRDVMMLIVDGNSIQVPLSHLSKKLLQASDELKNAFVISPSGYGIHWPELDEDLSVNKILEQAQLL